MIFVSTALREHVAPDGQRLALCRAGELAAWRALYDQYLPLVYRVACRLGVPDSEIGDLCQEVFLRVYRGLGTFRGDAQFSTWLYSIIVREATRARRARAVRNALLALLGRQPVVASPEPLARAEASWEVARVLARMKPKHRQVFVLFDLEELTLAEIAAALRCPLETVRSRLRHARAEFARLRRQDLAAGKVR
jgi:RNA polymerase sigma-70 factor (ECF subfamily)